MAALQGTRALEKWCRLVTEDYDGVNVLNMTTSWRSGLAFCAVIHHFRPELLDFNELDPDDALGNCEKAFGTAEQHLGIPALLDPQDMVECELLDRLSILTYLSQFYQAFHGATAPVKAPRTAALISRSAGNSPAKTAPPAAAMSMAALAGVGRRNEPCKICEKPVFILERLNVSGKLLHRTCFKCARCHTQLNLHSYYETEAGGYCCDMCPDEEITLVMTVEANKKIVDQHLDSGVEESSSGEDEDEDGKSTSTTKTKEEEGNNNLIAEIDVNHHNEIGHEDTKGVDEASNNNKDEDIKKSVVAGDNNLTDRNANSLLAVAVEDNKHDDDRLSTKSSKSNLNSEDFQDVPTITVEEAAAEKENSEVESDREEKAEVNAADRDKEDGGKIKEETCKSEESAQSDSPSLDEKVKERVDAEDCVAKGDEVGKSSEDEDKEVDRTAEEKVETTDKSGEEKKEEVLYTIGEEKKEQVVKSVDKEVATEESSDEDAKVDDEEDLTRKISSPTDMNPFGNPFGDEEEEEEQIEAMKESNDKKNEDIKTSCASPTTNPFGSDFEDEEEGEPTLLRSESATSTQGTPLTGPPKPPRSSLNPFGSDFEDDDEDLDLSRRSQLSTPSPATAMRRKKKRMAPKPPGSGEPSPMPSPRFGRRAPPVPAPRPSRSAPPRPASPSRSLSLRPPRPPPPTDLNKQRKERDNLNRRSQAMMGNPSATPPSVAAELVLTPLSPDKASTDGQWKRKKGPAPPRPIPQKRQVKKLPRKAVNTELQDIEIKQQELERQGVRLEKTIREVCEKNDQERVEAGLENKDRESLGPEVEDLIVQLFDLVNEKNDLYRRQTELMYMKRDHRLEEEHADIEHQIRLLMAKTDDKITDEDSKGEEKLILRLMEVVAQRNEIVDCLEMDRLREREEDESFEVHMGEYAAVRPPGEDDGSAKKKLKKKKKKEKEKEKKGKKKNKTFDADKDIDTSENPSSSGKTSATASPKKSVAAVADKKAKKLKKKLLSTLAAASALSAASLSPSSSTSKKAIQSDKKAIESENKT